MAEAKLPTMDVTPERSPLLFLHIPKTAGMSLRQFLRTQYRASTVMPAEDWPGVIAAGLDPHAYALFVGHFRMNFRHAAPLGTKLLTVLRDPVARYLSSLRHARRDPAFDSRHEELKSLSLDDAIRHPAFGRTGANAQTGWLSACADVATVTALLQAQPLADVADAEPASSWEVRYGRAAEHLRHIDFVGLYEQLSIAIEDLCRGMGFHPPVALPVANVSPHEKHDLPSEDVGIIRKLNEYDVELYARAREIGETNRRMRAVFDLATNGFYKTPPESFAIDLADPMPGDGWHAPETDGGTVWRWTNGSLATTLDLPRAPVGKTVCQLSFFRRWAHAGDVAFKVFVNGIERPHDLDPSGEHSVLCFTVEVPVSASTSCSIRLLTTRTRPQQSDGKDKRNLGVPVFKIEFLAELPPPAA